MRYRHLRGRADIGAAVGRAKGLFVGELRALPSDLQKFFSENPKQLLLAPLWLVALPIALLVKPPLVVIREVLAAIVSGARNVEADEGEASEEELRRRLLARELRTGDLVLIGEDWRTFLESPPFWEISEDVRREDRLRVLAAYAGILLVLIPATALIVYFVLSRARCC